MAFAKASIIEALERRQERELSLQQLLDELKATTDDPAIIKAAIWALVAESAVELTPAYTIKARPELLAR
jgi:hypothetical protein